MVRILGLLGDTRFGLLQGVVVVLLVRQNGYEIAYGCA